MSTEIVEARLCHLRALARTMRADDRLEVAASGLEPRHLLFRLWTGSFIRKTALFDGEVAAVWGCGGALLSDCGEAWLLTSYAIERKPIYFAKTLKLAVAEMLETKREIVSHVLSSYQKSIRLMSMAGFKTGKEIEIRGQSFVELRAVR